MRTPVLDTTTPNAVPPVVEQASPVAVLAEGTAPVAIAYHVPAVRSRSPWLTVGAAVVGTLVVAVLTGVALSQRADERAFSSRYPVATTQDEAKQLADGSARWAKGERQLLTALAQFSAPALESLKGTGACTLPTAGTLRFLVRTGQEQDLARNAQPDIASLIADGHRTRFASDEAKQRALTGLAGPVIVLRVTAQREPELDRARDTVAPGVLAGTAYAFDPATGRLVCAGALHAVSPSAPSLSQFSGLDAAQSAARDAFATEIDRSLASALRAVD